jgi:hypothetical protein
MFNRTFTGKVNVTSMQATPEPSYPAIVKVYKQRYDKMTATECKQQLRCYAANILHDPIEGLDWKQLLNWEHRHFKFTRGQLPKPRAEMPIEIILQAKGRCGEFALLYNGLTLANDYKTRMVIDCSTLRDASKKAAGDHVWNELLANGNWVHVDPTERRINQPSMYSLEWQKDVNLVLAISEKGIFDVTSYYDVNARF